MHVTPENLAYGAFTHPSVTGGAHIGVRVGDQVLDLTVLAQRLDRPYAELVRGPVLNPLMAAGPAVWAQVLEDVASRLEAPDLPLLPRAEVTLVLPFEVADYVDFYSSEQHATNVGRMFRPDAEPLTPNWKHLPIGYHGRAGTVVVSGTPVVRPCGQRKAPGEPAPTYGPSQRLDFEAEVGFVVGVGTPLGSPVPVSGLAEHVFGVVLLNDWSARDLQAWEYVPLGPFLGKSFATSISAWVVPLTSLLAARVAPPPRDPPLLDYLVDDEPWGLDLAITVSLNGHVISRPGFASMYWTAAQQLAHMTVNGASLRTGDLFGSGTVSDSESFGSLLELSWNGRDLIAVGDGTRTFLADGDEVVLTATAPGPGGGRVELGEVRGTIQPAVTAGRPDLRGLEWLGPGTTRLFDLVSSLPSLAEPSLLDGWSRHTLVAHLALNARALHNLVDWARTGVETPMYPSPEARAADIAALAARPEAEVRQSMVDTDAAFQAALRSLPPERFSAPVRTAQGRTIPASEIPWMRNREVWVHAVDLNAGGTFDDIPAEVLVALLDDASSLMAVRPEAVSVTAHATDVDRTWTFGPDAGEVVSGSLAQVCAWALGRRAVPDWPTLPRWL